MVVVDGDVVGVSVLERGDEAVRQRLRPERPLPIEGAGEPVEFELHAYRRALTAPKPT